MIIKVEFDDLELIGFDGGGSEIFNYQGQPFNGMLLTKGDNNIVRSEEEFQNGYKDGVQRYFYASGSLQQEYFLKDNDLHGVFKQWDKGGNLIKETSWENGVKIS
jgi:antitoxin component YwqK of YwqJK toxin-antitoxin module